MFTYKLFYCLLPIIICVQVNSIASTPVHLKSNVRSIGELSSLNIFRKFNDSRNGKQMKSYSGLRISNDSLLMIYYYDTTVVVAELGDEKLLLNCEIIEINSSNEGDQLLKSLSKYNRPLQIKFREMITLMNQCEVVDKMNYANAIKLIPTTTQNNSNFNDTVFKLSFNLFPNNPLSILSGIIPGTKWCGTGDIATTYRDLGTELNMDRCCRQHDLCPVKIRSFQRKYGLNNESIYTKSHCTCDDILFGCLRKSNTSISNFMGTIYFNLLQVPCLADEDNRYKYRRSRGGF